jgi:hypothetical protein
MEAKNSMAAATARPDSLEVFDAVCQAAGIHAGAERIGLLLELPRELQERLWAEAATRLGEKGAA